MLKPRGRLCMCSEPDAGYLALPGTPRGNRRPSGTPFPLLLQAYCALGGSYALRSRRSTLAVRTAKLLSTAITAHQKRSAAAQAAFAAAAPAGPDAVGPRTRGNRSLFPLPVCCRVRICLRDPRVSNGVLSPTAAAAPSAMLGCFSPLGLGKSLLHGRLHGLLLLGRPLWAGGRVGHHPQAGAPGQLRQPICRARCWHLCSLCPAGCPQCSQQDTGVRGACCREVVAEALYGVRPCPVPAHAAGSSIWHLSTFENRHSTFDPSDILPFKMQNASGNKLYSHVVQELLDVSQTSCAKSGAAAEAENRSRPPGRKGRLQSSNQIYSNSMYVGRALTRILRLHMLSAWG